MGGFVGTVMTGWVLGSGCNQRDDLEFGDSAVWVVCLIIKINSVTHPTVHVVTNDVVLL